VTDRDLRGVAYGDESGRLARDETISRLAQAFDPARLTQARRLAELTKRAVAEEVGVSAAAVGHWESGATSPRQDHLRRLAVLLDVEPEFLTVGRRYVRLEVADAHFRSLRATPARLREKAIAFTEQIWELAYALERRVQLPLVDLPGFAGGEVQPGAYANDPAAAAQHLRQDWNLGRGPIPHLVRTMERHGLLVTLLPFASSTTKTIDAFSTSHLPRPIVALTPDRANDVFRHRFTAAHELGHLLMHADTAPGDLVHEREADAFAAELLTPAESIVPVLPSRLDLHVLAQLARAWGVGIDSLIYRCHEVGRISDATYRRAFLRLAQLRQAGLFQQEPVSGYPGEEPVLLTQAFSVAEREGLTLRALAGEMRISLPRLRSLLGQPDTRPDLHLL